MFDLAELQRAVAYHEILEKDLVRAMAICKEHAPDEPQLQGSLSIMLEKLGKDTQLLRERIKAYA